MYFFRPSLLSGNSFWAMNARTFLASVIFTCRAITSGRSISRSKTMVSAGQRLMPRHFE